MIHHRTKDEVFRFDVAKLIVLLILIALLLFLTLCRAQTSATAPELTDPAAGSALTAGPLTLSGTGDAGSTVQILAGGTVLGTAVVGSDGTWSFDTELDAGETEFTFATLDDAGDVAATSSSFAFTVAEMELDIDTPTFSLPDAAVGLGALALSGTGTPGSMVEIMQNGVSLGTAEVGSDGNWSFDVDLAEAGEFDFVVNGLDGDNNVVASSDAQTLTVEGLEIAAPSFELPDTPMVGPFALMGTGTPGSTVEIVQNGEVLGTAVVGDDGTWSFDLDWPDAGDYELSLNALDANGNVVASSEAQTFNVGAAEVVVFPVEFDLPELGEFAAGDGGLPTGQLTLNGRSDPNATIEIYADGELVGTTTADADGNWSFDETISLPTGSYDLSVRSLDADGVVLSESEPIALEIPEVVVGSVPTLAALRSGVTSNEEVMLTGTAVPGSEVEIIVAGEVIETVTADAGGNWRTNLQLPAGGYTIVARSGDINSLGLALTVVDAATAGTLQVVYAPATEEDSGGSADSASSVVASLPTVEFILDASWSMTRGIAGVPRINIARQTMISIVNDVLPDNAPVALRAYGNIEGNYACRTDLMVPLGPLDQAEMVSTIEGIQPIFNANTPIADSLAEVPNDLGDAEGEIIVVLLTDGEETCDGDPSAAIAALVDQGIDVRVDIVGLDIADETLQAEFQRWAELGGGQYYNAADSAELVGALSQSLGVGYLVQDEAGEGVAVGIIGGPALKLPPGTYNIQIISAPDVEIEPVTIGEGEMVEVTID